jgi:hypothetical protein
MKEDVACVANDANKEFEKRIVGSNFERMAAHCYNPRVPHGPSATINDC